MFNGRVSVCMHDEGKKVEEDRIRMKITTRLFESDKQKVERISKDKISHRLQSILSMHNNRHRRRIIVDDDCCCFIKEFNFDSLFVFIFNRTIVFSSCTGRDDTQFAHRSIDCRFILLQENVAMQAADVLVCKILE